MSNPVIRVEHLSKKYTVGRQQGGNASLRDTITASVKNFTAANKRTSAYEEFWALKDVSFEIEQGAKVGVIGRNGAGKSTLLKVLSRITEPTEGRVSIYGRVASLLEVGTGFHPELTGRENIFMNGSILGMSKVEIARKFDQIVDFAEVERFLDTPVKRYSSGMYVRLAFAVAAHLEPEVLIVDEVLAVGDATFQKKCLGKMQEVSQGGRTVLFVSHNMASIRALCPKTLFMKNGQLLLDASTEDAIDRYLAEDSDDGVAMVDWAEQTAPQSSEIRFSKAYVLNDGHEYASTIDCRKDFTLALDYEVLKPIQGLRIGFAMQNIEGVPICGSNDPAALPDTAWQIGRYTTYCNVPGHVLNAGNYSVLFGADVSPYNGNFLVLTPYCLTFTIEDFEGHGPMNTRLPGVVRPRLAWSVNQFANC
jgi:lipopolysaccharide transport system ATP-binding protein